MVKVVIPTRSDDKRLEACLSSIHLLDNISVIDSEHRDSTCLICRKFGVEYLVYENTSPHYYKKRNWYLDKYGDNDSWYFFLDTDEILSLDVEREILSKTSNSDHNAFWLYYNVTFGGAMINFGLQQRKIALFKGAYRYQQNIFKDLGSFDIEVHEHPIISGKVGKIRSKVFHNEFVDYATWIKKHAEYAKWEAKVKNSSVKSVTLRQKVKYWLIGWKLFPLLYFVFVYIFKLGFLDGRSGLDYSILKSFYFYMINLELKVISNNEK